jgi:hypothetical protein
MHNIEMSNWPTQKIESDSISKLGYQTRVKMKNKQEINHISTSMGHMSIGFNKICAHQLWEQSINTMVT